MNQPRPGIRSLVVIVNFRSTDVLVDCLEALAPDASADPSIHVAICENGSGDDSAERIRRLIDDENPRKPLSDAKLADLLKSSGIPVARRTVAKYREAMNISASHERVRIA